MKKTFPLLALLVTTFAFSSGTLRAGDSVYTKTRIPFVRVNHVTFGEALAFLQKAARAQKPGGKPNPDANSIHLSAVGTPPDTANITLELKNVSLLDAVKTLADRIGYKVKIVSSGLIVYPPGQEPMS